MSSTISHVLLRRVAPVACAAAAALAATAPGALAADPQAPVVSIQAPDSVEEAADAFATAIASDPQGDPLTYSWSIPSNGFVLDPSGESTLFAGLDGPQSLTLELTVSDGVHETRSEGGEEFGIIFNGLAVEEALNYCERLRKELAAQPIDADGEPLTITVSAGLAAISGRETFDNYLNAADQFLYMAKHAGRNCVFSELSLTSALAS